MMYDRIFGDETSSLALAATSKNAEVDAVSFTSLVNLRQKDYVIRNKQKK